MISSVTSQDTDEAKKRAKSASPDLQVMHDQTNNSYHTSTYRHQAQTRQQNNRSAKSLTTFNENASCDSPASPLKGSSFSPIPTPTAAPAVLPHSTTADENDYSSTSIDYNSLCDAMDSTSSSMDSPTSQHNSGDSLDTMLSYLCKYDELAQHLDAMDQMEPISFLRVMYLGITSSEERCLFLKKLSDGLSETFFRHTPSTLSPHSLAPSSTTTTGSNHTNKSPPHPCRFRERKHHILSLDLFLANNMMENVDDYNDDDYFRTAMFEDNGVSIVEADFTTDNNNLQPNHRHDPELILHYIYTQCQHTRLPVTLKAILNPPSHWNSQHFTGRIFSDDKSSGIDLCVYFYHDAQDMAQVNKDMETLWKISALGIPILPILSVSQQIPPLHSPSSSSSLSTTETPPSLLSPNSRLLSKMATTSQPTPTSQNYTPRDYGLKTGKGNDNDDLYHQQRPIDVRRNELAYLFSRWRIKMMDISNLDTIGQPSFQSKGKTRWTSVHEDMVIENLLGHTWADSSFISPTPYHVLTLHQLMTIDRWAISKLLVAVKDQSKDQRQHLDDGDNDEPPPPATIDPEHPISDSTTSSPSASKTIISGKIPKEPLTPSTVNHHSGFQPTRLQFLDLLHMPATFYIWLFLILALLLVYGFWMALISIGSVSTPAWHGSLNMVPHQTGKSMNFVVNIYDGHGQLAWAPESPLLITNMPFPIISSTTAASSSCLTNRPKTTTTTCYSTIKMNNDSTWIVFPLANKTLQHQTLEGQYFYLVPVPPCSALNTTIDYYVQVQPSTLFPPNPPGIVQGSPCQIPAAVFCSQEDDSTAAGTNAIPLELGSSQGTYYSVMEAFCHFMQHPRFYLVNWIKILELSWTAGE